MATEIIEAMPGFKFGADPELFIQNEETLEFVSAGGIIPGTKEKPHKVPFGSVQQDGVAAEFNIDPVSTFEAFDHHIVRVIKAMKEFLPAGHRLVGLPSAVFSEEAWAKVPDSDKVLGCSPDLNAWTADVNPPPEMEGELHRTRCAGGHIHFGWTEDADVSSADHLKNAHELVQQLDYYLGGWSLYHDKEPIRRQLYGKAGACRVKSYGVEYRTLSNFWLQSRKMRLETWNRMNRAIWDMRKQFRPEVGKAMMPGKPYSFNAALIESINTSTLDPALVKGFTFPIKVLNN